MGDFYDFYNFYDVSHDAERLHHSGPQRITDEQPILQLCVIAAAPLLGPDTGGTEVTLLLSGQVKKDVKNMFCKFGNLVVEVTSFQHLHGSDSVAIMCAPQPLTALRRDGDQLIIHPVWWTCLNVACACLRKQPSPTCLPRPLSRAGGTWAR